MAVSMAEVSPVAVMLGVAREGWAAPLVVHVVHDRWCMLCIGSAHNHLDCSDTNQSTPQT